jgi:O-antigen/teichoic acid export membrane protein
LTETNAPQSGLGKAVAKGAAWNVAVNVASQFSSFLVFLVLAQLLPPEDIGIVTIANAILGLLWIFVDQGYSTAIMRLPEIDDGRLNTAFWLTLGTSLLVVAMVFTAAPFVATAYASPELTGVLRVIVLGMAFGAASSVQAALLLRQLKFRAHGVRRLVAIFAGGAVGLGMAYSNFGVWSLVGKQVAEAVTECLLTWALVQWRPKFEFVPAEARSMFGFGSKLAVSNLTSYVTRRSGEFIIGIFLGNALLAQYAVATRAIVLLNEVCILAATRSFLPVLAKLQVDRSRFHRAVKDGLAFSALVVLPSYAGLAAVSEDLTPLLFGEQWQPAADIMKVLALGGLPTVVTMLAYPVLTAKGNSGAVLVITAFSAVMTAISTTGLVRLGILAVSFVPLLRGLLVAPLCFKYLRDAAQLKFSHVLSAMTPALGSTILMVLCVELLKYSMSDAHRVTRVVTCVCGGALVYGIASWFSAPTLRYRVTQLMRRQAA